MILFRGSMALTWLLAVVSAQSAIAQHQTATFSPIAVGSQLPYRVDHYQTSLQGATLPTLHSFAAAEYDGKWVMVAGRTNGLHGASQAPLNNFPPAYRSHDVWVVDPATGESWSRSLLTDPQSGLSEEESISIATTNNQFTQVGQRLYLTGGYTGLDTVACLTAIDLPGLVSWVQNGTGLASHHIRQVSNEAFAVTGGAMYEMAGRMHLVFGQDYEGGYTPGLNGTYTRQVRSFDVVDDGTTLSFANLTATTPEDSYRRRDLNVFPTLSSDGAGGVEEGLVALAGVFTNQLGVWTVPVKIDESGQTTMADPLDPATFKQGMNQYHSGKFGMYSRSQESMHEVLMGGITVEYFDASGALKRDNAAPNTSQMTAIAIDGDGQFSQHFLGSFPTLTDGTGKPWRLGANAEFFRAEGVPTFENGVIDFDQLPAGENLVGHVFGGLAANAPHVFGNPNTASVASNWVFEVVVTIQEGDYNRDGIVDAADYVVWRNSLGDDVNPGTFADGDRDGKIDADDFLVWKAYYGEQLSQPLPGALVAAVPEPATGMILLLLALPGYWLTKTSGRRAPIRSGGRGPRGPLQPL